MRKRVRLVLALVLAAALTPTFAQGIKYARSSIGADIGLVLPGGLVGGVGAAFDGAMCGDIAFTLGRYGEVHYKPNIGTWFGGHEYAGVHWSELEVHFDVADFAYYVPLPDHIIVRPYAGIGPMFAINHWAWTGWGGATNVRFGFNFFGGADFRITSICTAYAEILGRASEWGSFTMSGGMRWTIGGH